LHQHVRRGFPAFHYYICLLETEDYFFLTFLLALTNNDLAANQKMKLVHKNE